MSCSPNSSISCYDVKIIVRWNVDKVLVLHAYLEFRVEDNVIFTHFYIKPHQRHLPCEILSFDTVCAMFDQPCPSWRQRRFFSRADVVWNTHSALHSKFAHSVHLEDTLRGVSTTKSWKQRRSLTHASPWFPVDAVISSQDEWFSRNQQILFTAPRTLKEPVTCSFSKGIPTFKR